MAASEQGGVAGEAAPRHHADERHLATERAEQCEGFGVESGDHGHVGVTGPAAAALGEQHHREAQALDKLEETVLLAMVHLALRAGENGIVVRQHGAARPFFVEEVTVDPADTHDQSVGRGVGDEVVLGSARPLRGDDEPAVLVEAAGVAEVLDVLARRAPPAGVPAFRGGGTPRIEGGGHPGPQLGQLGAIRGRISSGGRGSGRRSF